MKQDTVTSDWEEIRGSQGQSRGVLLARTYEQQEFMNLDGELTEAAVETAEIRLPADPELAEELGHALLDYHAENQQR
jgi:acyl-coenzyme A thioesterase PaaI-like protein